MQIFYNFIGCSMKLLGGQMTENRTVAEIVAEI